MVIKIFLTLSILFTATRIFSQDLPDNTILDTIKLSLSVHQNIDTTNFNVFPKSYSDKKVALVLSGGGARGISQLGVIRELEKNNIRIDMIVGTSIGSMIGGLYSAGYATDEIENVLSDFDWNRALSLTNKYLRTNLFLEQKELQDRSLLTIPLDGIKPVILPSSLSNGYYLSEKINSYILNARYHPKKNFSDLKIPFTAVATNIDNGKRVILDKGNLSESIKASLTFPLLYTPINIDGQNLVDGGLTSNIPNDVAKMLGADYTIVVNSTSPLKSNRELDDPLNTADQILSISMAQLNSLQLKDANVVINPDIKNYSSTNYSNFPDLISKGQEKASAYAGIISWGIDSLDMSSSKYFNNFITNPILEINSGITFPDYRDTLLSLTDRQFEKYTSVEKNLRMIYRSGLFKNVYAVISRQGLTAYLRYYLDANPELTGIETKNSPSIVELAINDFKRKQLNKTINVFVYQKFYDHLLGVLRKNSLSLVEITRFYFDHNTGRLEIEFSDGKINGIKLDGNRTTNSNVILREVNINSVNPVRKKDIDNSINNVMSTNLFKQVSFDFDYMKNRNKPDLKIKMVEKNTKALRFSLKVDNEKNLQLLLDIRDENLFGSAVEAGFLAAGGLRNRIYELEVKTNLFFRLPLTFNYNLFYTFRDYNRYVQVTDTNTNEYEVNKIGEYRSIDYGMSFLLGTQLERLGTIYAQAFFENERIKDKFGSTDLPVEYRFIKLKFGGTFDTEDKIPFPTQGSLINFYYETANDVLSGNLSYSKLFLSYEQYFPVAKSQTFRPRFIFGFADLTTPLTEHFSLGGEKSFFGMFEDEIRGRQILETSLEYRYLFPYKIFFDTYLSVRYDLGNIWQQTQDIRFKDLRHGIGVTTAFDTPIGEASFSVGRSFEIKKGLTKDSFIFGPYDFYFSIGYDI